MDIFLYFSRVMEQYPFHFGILFLLSLWLIISIYDYFNVQHSQSSRKLKKIIEKERKGKKKEELIKLGESFIEKQKEKITTELEKANVLFTVEEYAKFMFAGVIIGALVGLVIFPVGTIFMTLTSFLPGFLNSLFARLIAGGLFGYLGYMFPKGWLKYLIHKRRKMLNEQVQDSLLNIADALKSGHTIQDAIKIVGEEMNYPMGPEFARAHREMETGRTLAQALQGLKKRINLPDFDMAVNAMEIQFEVGGKLEPLLRNMVKITQERAELRKEIQKSIANSKTVGIVLLVAPIFFVVVFTLLNAETYLQMFKSIIGIVMLAIALGCYIIAAFFIVYIVKDVSKEAE